MKMKQEKVRLPDGSVQTVSYPENWSHEQKLESLRKLYPAKASEQHGESEAEAKVKRLEKSHPYLLEFSKKLAEHPLLAAGVKGAAESPVTEAALSAGPGLVNAFGNMINTPEIFTGKKIVPKLERGFPEPTNLSGMIGSKIGDILGAGTAMALVPGAGTIPGGLATGFLQGEGDLYQRSMDALVGLLFPGAIHAGKFGKTFLESKKHLKNIRELEHQKAAGEREVFNAKESLANKLNPELEQVKEAGKGLAQSAENIAGPSVSEAKTEVGKQFKAAEDKIVKKFNNLYEGFNASPAGQTLVKEPVKVPDLVKEYGMKLEDFSPQTRNLIHDLVGTEKHIPESEMISRITGKPTNQASIEIENAKPPKVADYINLWKQLRAEVAEMRHAMKRAETPESKRAYREKANQLEKLSDDINSKAMGSMDEAAKKEYGAIQKGYLNERVPFIEEPVLKNATDKFPKVPSKIHEKLNVSGFPELMKALKSEHPELVSAIARHDLKGLGNMGLSEIKEMVKGDFAKFVPPEIRARLNQIHDVKSAEDLLSKALGHIQKSEISRKVRASDIKDITDARPDLAKPFKKIEAEQERVRKLKDALVEAGFKLKDAEKAMNKYKSAGSFAKAAGLPIGAYAGIIKSKASTSGNENDY